MFESLFFQSLISFEFFDLLILILHKLFCMLYYGVLQTFQANQMNNQTHFLKYPIFTGLISICVSGYPPRVLHQTDTHVTVSSEDMLEVKKFPLLLQLLIKSNIFSNLSKLRNYTSSLIKITFRQIIQ